MIDCASDSHCDPTPSQALNLLLVSSDRQWSAAVTGAAADLGLGGISSCDARGALARLSDTRNRYSHLLVQPESADGLIETFADMTSSPAGSDTSMLILGNALNVPPGIGVIQSADRQAIRAALSAPRFSQAGREGAILTSELREALAGAMIETRYQPIVAMSDGTPSGLEALARLNHPTLGTLAPDRFVPQMEDAGLAAQLTEIVSRQAFADMTGPFLRDLGLRITINFPLDVLLAQGALDRLEEQRAASGIAPERVIVELTESRPVEDMRTLRVSLEWLRSRGYKVAIDDVGPAVPRLTPLLELPFTAIKLDMGLVRHVEENPEVRAFLALSIAQAHARGMTVVAEGIETVPLWRAMKALGVDAAQGFLVARPLPVAAVPIWLAAWKDTPPIV
jgi:EAL domain-containing protein (putative c-di-GMP-specific phosphodiesterase class I)